MPDFSSWSPKDFALLGGALGATYADVQSTKDIIKRGGAETNPIFGTPHPTGAALDQGGLAAAGLMTAAAHGIPEKYRGAFLGGWMGFEGATVARNERLPPKGKQISFSEAVTAAMPAAALSAAAGYLLPSGSGDSTILPTILPNGGKGAFGVSYTRKF